MIKNKKILFPLFILLFLAGILAVANKNKWFDFGQTNELPDAREEIKKLFNRYSHPDSSINMKGMIRLYDEENDHLLKEETTFIFKKHGLQVYNSLGYLQIFCADSLIVQLDTVNKYILLSKLDQKMMQILSHPINFPSEQWLSDSTDFKIDADVIKKNNYRTLIIKNNHNPDIKSSSITYDPVTYKVKSAEIVWWKNKLTTEEDEKNNKVWVTKITYDHLPPDKFAIDAMINKIIRIEKNKTEVAPAYKGYRVETTFEVQEEFNNVLTSD